MGTLKRVTPRMDYRDEEDEKDDEEIDEDAEGIEWSNIIFLPFHPVFQFVILVTVIIRIILSCIEAPFPIISCGDEIIDSDIYLTIIKYIYEYVCDVAYGLDTLLHIVHRLASVAKRRQYPPKPKWRITLDVISLLPVHKLITSEQCPPMKFWPNVLNMISVITIYRIVEYFSLGTSHNFWSIFIGYTILFLVTSNAITCFLILVTYEVPYINIPEPLMDWRKNLIIELQETDMKRAKYMSSLFLVISYSLPDLLGDTKPSMISVFVVISVLMIASFAIFTNVAYPKAFAEAVLRMRLSFEFFPRVQKIVAETKRRAHCPEAYVDVRNFYNLVWQKRGGITTTPEIILEFPRHLRLDVKKDMTWPIFYHSPTLRRVSSSFIHWLCDLTHLDFKLPNENFFASPHCRANLFYLKSGIVQLMSTEDGTTPILSMTSGTVFGDINFFLPPASSKTVIVRCLTYCEIYFFTRADILKALHKFPEDRKKVMERIQNKIKHARTLYACKQHVRGLDRTEDEGVAWIKRRWWELNEAISNWKHATVKSEAIFVFPPEEAVYHCSKYIGQLVLCTDENLERRSMFANCQFPWILVPVSTFTKVWQIIVKITVLLVLVLYPPHLPLTKQPDYFFYFKAWTNTVYIADFSLSLLTAIEEQGHLLADFASVMFKRCKTRTFILTLLATVWLEEIVILLGRPELYSICQFNRLIKVYVIFFMDAMVENVKSNPVILIFSVPLLFIAFMYVTGYFIMALTQLIPSLSLYYFYGSICGNEKWCDLPPYEMFKLFLTWAFRDIYVNTWPTTVHELYAEMILDYVTVILAVYCAGHVIAIIYLKNKFTADFLFYSIQLKDRFQAHHIHPELLKRLFKYLVCYWKDNKNLDMTEASLLRHEPYDIYWKAHGEIAFKIITMCKAFVGANPALIKELAHTAKFTILPSHSTILLAGVSVKDVCWLVNGVIIKEYTTETGVEMETIYGPDDRLVSCSAVFFGKPSLVTCTSLTECEMLCISTIDFFRVINQYPIERLHIRSCIESFKTYFHDLFKVHMAITTVDQWNEIGKPSKAKAKFLTQRQEMPATHWRHPAAKFTKCWMIARAVVFAISVIVSSLQGGSLARYRPVLMVINAICDCFILFDVIVKCSTAYYDERGILIYSIRKCIIHYLTRGFAFDLIAMFPWDWLPEISPLVIRKDSALLLYALSKYARLNMFLGYFDFLSDFPLANVTVIMLVKWQLFTMLILFSTTHYLILECVKFEWDNNFVLVNTTRRPKCWLPRFIKFDLYPTPKQMEYLIAESFNLGQCASFGVSYGLFHLENQDKTLAMVFFVLITLYCCSVFGYLNTTKNSAYTFFKFPNDIERGIFCYSLAVLTLSRRGSALFRHAFSSLNNFLNAERLDETLIRRSLAHFSYWWIRTNGINIYDTFIHGRVSSLFRQDIIFFLYKQTFQGLNALLNGSDQMMKQLACVSSHMYLLPGVPVMREMDLNPWVFVIHRGEVVISQEGVTLAVLKKGSIFGQLEGTEHRPVKVSAHTADYSDILRISVNAFQENIDDKTRGYIHRNSEAALDYIQVKDPPKDNPYNTIKYLLRAGKTIQLPWMKQPLKAHVVRWYAWWLAFVWLLGPYFSTAIVVILNTLPLIVIKKLLVILIILDLFHLAHFLSEFYTMELVIINDVIINRTVKLRKFRDWQTYSDLVSLLVPIFTSFNGNWAFQLARILRVRYFYDFYKFFCQGFKSQKLHYLLDFVIISLIVHTMVCGWVAVACRPSIFENTYYIPKYVPEMDKYQKYYNEWIDPAIRGEGCQSVVFGNKTQKVNSSTEQNFIVPLRWQDDYAIALGFVMSLFARTNSGNYAATTLREMYFNCCMCYVSNLICIWISSSAIRSLYLKYRELLNFDYNKQLLFSYLKHNGLNESLLERVKEYTVLLWQRQRGNWIPELVLEAPLCLREDLYMALYSYHLYDIPLFKQQPAYFIRQLATRLHRVVICQGRELIQEGDIFACIYFIHDGEVEKWTTDASGEKKMVSLLTTNGFFGLISGLFPETPVQFTFVTRTVVDVVYLRNKDWQDLLAGYPDIKRDLYAAAKHLKKDLGKP